MQVDSIIPAPGATAVAATQPPVITAETSEAPAAEVQPRSAGEAYRAWGRAVWRVLRCRGLAGDQLEDATQEVFLIAHRQWDSIRDESKRRSWLFGIAANVAKQFMRGARKSTRTALTDFSGENDPPAPASQWSSPDARESAEILESLLDRLPEDQRMAVVLCRIEGWTAREVADALQTNQRGVNTRLETAERRLRNWLDQVQWRTP